MAEDKDTRTLRWWSKKIGRGLWVFTKRFLFIIYLLMGLYGTTMWIKINYDRSLTPRAVFNLVVEKQNSGYWQDALATLRSQEISKSRALLDVIEPEIEKLMPIFYFEVARRYMIVGDTQRALFWHAAGTYKLNYHGFLCTDHKKAHEFIGEFRPLMIVPDILAYGQENPRAYTAALDQVILWDQTTEDPSRPEYLCNLARLQYPEMRDGILEQEYWPIYRQGFRDKLLKNRKKFMGDAPFPEMMDFVTPKTKEGEPGK